MSTSKLLSKLAYSLLITTFLTGCSEAQVQLSELSQADTLVAFTAAKDRIGFGQPPYGDAWIYNHRTRSFHSLTNLPNNIEGVRLYWDQEAKQVKAFVAAALMEDHRVSQLGASPKLQRLPLSPPSSLLDKEDYRSTTVQSLSVCSDGSAGAYVDLAGDSPVNNLVSSVYMFKSDPFTKKAVSSVDLLGQVTNINCETIAVDKNHRDSTNAFHVFNIDGFSHSYSFEGNLVVLDMSSNRGVLYLLVGNRNEGLYKVFSYNVNEREAQERCVFEDYNRIGSIAVYGDVLFMSSKDELGYHYIEYASLSTCEPIKVEFEGYQIGKISTVDDHSPKM